MPVLIRSNIAGHIYKGVASLHLLCSSSSFSSLSVPCGCSIPLFTFQPPECLLPLSSHDRLSVFLPDLFPFYSPHTLNFQPPCQSSARSRGNFDLSPSYSDSQFLYLSGFIHFKPRLMMNEPNVPGAQTCAALWDSSQLAKGTLGLIPYSKAPSTPVLLICCTS